MQLGTKVKKTPKKTAAEHASVTTNKAGGQAYTIEGPAEYLLATIGSSMFNEPKYYTDDLKAKESSESGYNKEGLDEQAIRIIEACIKVCEGENPRDVLALANWARSELNMRTTPCVMTAVAARCIKARPWIKHYVGKVAQRPDDIKQIAGAYEHLFGRKGYPAALKKGLARAISQVNETGFLRYNGEGHPSWKDLLLFVDRRKNYPVSQPLFEYLVNGAVSDELKTISAHKKLAAKKTFDAEAKKLAKACHVSWETLVSQFGATADVYQHLIPQMGYMAVLRNLANFLTAGVDKKGIELVAQRLSDKDAVLKSRQLPYRYYAAFKALASDSAFGKSKKHDRRAWDEHKRMILADALDVAMQHAADAMPQFEGSTCIAVDVSGSMSNPISRESELTLIEAASILAALAIKASAGATASATFCIPFGSTAKLLTLSKHDSVMTIMTKIMQAGVGHATNAYAAIRILTERKIAVDRIVLLSDMQCYARSGSLGWSPFYMSSPGSSVYDELIRYRRVVNSKCFMHSVHLCSQDPTSQVPTDDDRSNMVSGFHQKLFDRLIAFEQQYGTAKENKQALQVQAKNAGIATAALPTLEYIRENF